jgi:predicted transcriptional regulator
MAKAIVKAAESETVSISVRLPKELRTRLEGVAADERRTLGNVIRIALEDWLKART